MKGKLLIINNLPLFQDTHKGDLWEKFPTISNTILFLGYHELSAYSAYNANDICNLCFCRISDTKLQKILAVFAVAVYCFDRSAGLSWHNQYRTFSDEGLLLVLHRN